MATQDDIKKRAQRLNPEGYALIQKHCADSPSPHEPVILIEGMTDEEEEMAIFEGYLKNGYLPEMAAQKANATYQVYKSNLA